MHLHLIHQEGFTKPLKLMGVAANYCVEYDNQRGICREHVPDANSANANSAAEIIQAIQDAGGGLRRIEALSFHSHGRSGSLAIGVNTSNVSSFRSACQQNLRPGATINFVACQVASGAEGLSFMRAAGRHMVPDDGGSAIAMESSLFTLPVGGTRAPAWGRLVVARKDSNGRVSLFRSRRFGDGMEELD